MFMTGGNGPWSTLDVDANGYYQVRLPLNSIYLLRPVASDYDFKGVPQSVATKKGDYVVTDFLAIDSSKRAWPPLRTGGGESSVVTSGIPRVLDAEDKKKLNALAPTILYVDAPSDQMVSPDAKASDGGKSKIDPIVLLPRRSTLWFHVESVLDNNGTAAKTLGEVAYKTPKVYVDQYGQKHTSQTQPVPGGPVEGARISVRLIAGRDLVEPQDSNWVEATTNAKGNAYLELRSGAHPGRTRLEVKLSSNPVNPWAVFSVERRTLVLQPAIHGDDTPTQPKVSIGPAFVREIDLPVHWWKMGRVVGDQTGESVMTPRDLPGDVNFDGVVDQKDLELVRKFMGTNMRQAEFKDLADLNNDGLIDQKDEAIVQRNLGRKQMRRIR
jgi:hypothetical protein